MFTLESIKFFAFFVLLFASLSSSSCGFRQTTAENQNVSPPADDLQPEESRSAAPFASKEPDVYQAEIVLTTYANGEKSERRIFTARNGAKSRCDFADRISSLQNGESQKFLIDRGRKTYAEIEKDSVVAGETGDSIKDFLTVEWLNEKPGATFEKLGTTDNLTKYQVRFADAENTNSELFIYIDENLKMPIRQEFYSVDGAQKVLMFSMTMQNLRLEADDSLFELPKDFRRVSASEFQKTIRQEKLKNERND